MREFGRQCFENYIYINFDNNPIAKTIFENDFDISRILRALNALTGEKIVPGETLLIFDEVQEAPRVLSSLKYFCEDAGEYHVVAAGSLLGTAIHSGISFPVGKVNTLDMYPMTYREFLLAMGERGLCDALTQGDYATVNSLLSKYEELLKSYLFVGGMPEAVQEFADNGDYGQVRKIQKELLEVYESDFGKHITGHGLSRVRGVWNAIPMQLSKENKKFFFGKVKEGGRFAEYETAIEWLKDSGLVYKVPRVSKPEMPLKAYEQPSAFKLFFVDVGLLAAHAGLDAVTLLNGSDIFTDFKGALTEQYVLQQLVSDGGLDAYYYSVSDSNEIDFLLQIKNKIIPVEVKSGRSIRSQSLKSYIARFGPDVAWRFSLLGFEKQETIVNMPLYAAGVLVQNGVN